MKPDSEKRLTMSVRTFLRLSLLLAVLAAVPLARTRALEPEDVLFYKWGPLSLRPRLTLSETYNDNVFYQSTNPIDDFITDISPGLKLQLGRPDHNYISLGYTLDQLLYVNNSDLNADQHSIDIADQFEWQRLRIAGTDRIQFLSSPLGGVVERVIGTNGVPVVIGRNVNRVAMDDSYTASYQIGEKTSAYLRGNHISSDYDQGIDLYDLETWTATGGFGYQLFPKTVMFGELYYGQTMTEPNTAGQVRNPRLDFMGGYLGMRGNFTQKLSGSVKVGYEFREFSDGGSAPSDPVVSMALTYQLSLKQALTLSYTRLNSVSVQYSRQTYIADSIGLQFNQRFGSAGKWNLGVGGNYTLYAYEQVGGSGGTLDYDYLQASANLTYQIQRWLAATLGYDFERVTGDPRAVIDYNVNRVTLRLAIGY